MAKLQAMYIAHQYGYSRYVEKLIAINKRPYDAAIYA